MGYSEDSDNEAPESVDNKAIKNRVLGEQKSENRAANTAKLEAKQKRRQLDEKLKRQKEEKRQKLASIPVPAPLPQQLLDDIAANEEKQKEQQTRRAIDDEASNRQKTAIKAVKREAVVGPVKVMTLEAVELAGRTNNGDFRQMHFNRQRVKRVSKKSLFFNKSLAVNAAK